MYNEFMGIKDIIFNNNENIYNNFPDAIIVLDFMRNIIIWNKKAEMIFGYTKAEVKNQNVMMLFNEDFEKFNKIIGLNHGSILKATTKTGESIFVDVTAYDAYNSARTIVSVRALSNKYLELQNLLDNYQTTKMLVSNRDCFLSNLKLDFTNPINAAIGFSQSLLDNVCGKLNDKQEKYISIINANNRKVKVLMDKVFEIISLDADTKEFNFKTFDYTQIINFATENNKSFADKKNIKILQQIDTRKKNIYSDEYALSEILDILINNAIKFSTSGNITIQSYHPTAETLEANEMKSPTGYSEKSYLQIDITDTGIGISEEKSTEIFDEYSSKNLSSAQKFEGSALSLPIAKKLVHKLNGTIWHSQNSPAGSIFSILIPIERMNFE